MHSRNTKTTNESTASNNKSDRPQVNIWDNWKTLKYLNINEKPDLKYLSRVLYILISCFFKQIVDIFFNNVYYQESYKLIIEYSVVPVAEWLDGSFESQSKL
jgi:hypothetical protein